MESLDADGSASSGPNISLADITRFLEDSAADEPMMTGSLMPLMPPMPAPGSAAPMGGASLMPALASTGARGGLEDGSGMSHVCNWPGCGKGFTSRWLLERHMANHQSATDGAQEQPDSFVERRLRERLKSVHQALEKAREKLSSHSRQQEQLDAELQDARSNSHQQQEELQMLQRQNVELVARMSPGVAQAVLNSANGTTLLNP